MAIDVDIQHRYAGQGIAMKMNIATAEQWPTYTKEKLVGVCQTLPYPLRPHKDMMENGIHPNPCQMNIEKKSTSEMLLSNTAEPKSKTEMPKGRSQAVLRVTDLDEKEAPYEGPLTMKPEGRTTIPQVDMNDLDYEKEPPGEDPLIHYTQIKTTEVSEGTSQVVELVGNNMIRTTTVT